MHENINLVTSDTKLLYDIRELLFEQNELLKSVLSHEVVDINIENNEQNEKIKCKYCGGTHENKGQELACAKKNKKGA